MAFLICNEQTREVVQWSEDSSGYWLNVDYYQMRIYKTDSHSSDKKWYLWRIWGPVEVGSSNVTRLLKSGCVSNLGYAKQSCVRAMRKHAKLAGVKP